MAKKTKLKKQKRTARGKTKKPLRSKTRTRKTASTERVAKNLRRIFREDERRKKKTRFNNQGYSSRAGKPKTRTTGTSARLKIFSKKENKNVILKKKTTLLSKKSSIKLTENKNVLTKVSSQLLPIAKKHYSKIGKSIKNKFYAKVKYTYSLNGKRRKSEFSIGNAEIKSSKNLEKYILKTVKAFQNKLESYIQGGFSNITIDGLSIQGYENP